MWYNVEANAIMARKYYKEVEKIETYIIINY